MINKKMIRFFVIFISLLTTSWLIIEYLLIGVLQYNPIVGTGVSGVLSIIFISAFISLLVIQLTDNKTDLNPPNEKDKDVLNSLVIEIHESYSSNNWEEVIKIGSVLSRPLWITGKYRLRIKLGKMVESSAAHAGHPKEQAQALIDDLGWTNFEVGNVSEAKRNIEHGIKVAIDSQEFNLVYKGYRHMSGIYLNEGDFTNSKKFLSQSDEIIPKLLNENEKRTAIAGNLVNEAMILEKELKFEIAFQKYKSAFDMYDDLKDNDRKVKLFSFIGNNLLNQNKNDEANDYFRKGLAEAKKESRRDCILKCLIGLATISEIEPNKAKALSLYKKALDVAEEMGNEDKLNDIKSKISKL
jgi:tetratricopeptide (TPR) repeat protein